jgi:cephalosporin-C deacetylase-like acetyl esterase
MRHVLPPLAALLLAAPALAQTGPWKLAELRKPPKVTGDTRGNLRATYYDNVPYKGKPTRVFAYLALPEDTKAPAPAMVLVHGGGGKAFKQWARLWAKRGYVALAMDLGGMGPDGKRLADGGPGQSDREKFFFEGKAEDYWTYHAVAAVIRGLTLVAGMKQVDASRIGITGISWGGYLTCIVAGLDDRVKVAIPVYGCGFIHENSAWNDTFAKLKDDRRSFWVKHFEPSKYVGRAKMPVLFVNGTNDFAYPLDSYGKTYRLVKDRTLCVTARMPHSHEAGWAPKEIGLFADQHLKKGKPLATVVSTSETGGAVEVRFKPEVPVKSAALCWTTDTGAWEKRRWRSKALTVGDGVVKGELPEGRPVVWFVTLTDERKATVSSEHEVVR